MRNVIKLAKVFNNKCFAYYNKNKLQKVARTISNEDRITLSSLDKLDSSRLILSAEYPHTNKPNGFYYAFGAGWIDFLGESSGEQYIYSLDLNDAKIYKLTPENLESFVKKFGRYVSSIEAINRSRYFSEQSASGHVIDWREFKRHYSGIEIADLAAVKEVEKEKFGFHAITFLQTFDVDGGCFWDKSVLVKATKIASVKDGEIKNIETPEDYTFDEDAALYIKNFVSSDDMSKIEIEPAMVSESQYYSVIHKIRDELRNSPFDNKEHPCNKIYKEYISGNYSRRINEILSAFEVNGYDALRDAVRNTLLEQGVTAPQEYINYYIQYIMAHSSRIDTMAEYAYNKDTGGELKNKRQIIEEMQKIFPSTSRSDLNAMADAVFYAAYQKMIFNKY
jgi:hypothetical protein